jgi:pyruvate/2-oxoacid:ferredoxin oxidoreductase alpha subunit
MDAFELADKYRCTAIVLADGAIGQTMEPVEFPEELHLAPKKSWAVEGTAQTRKNLISSIYMSPETLLAMNQRLAKRYEQIEASEARYEDFMTESASLIVVAYGVTSRVAQTAIEDLRREGMKVGMLRLKTLYPCPKKRLMELAGSVKVFLAAEMSNGQMINDVKLAIEHKRPVDFFGTGGGLLPTVEAMKESIASVFRKRVG